VSDADRLSDQPPVLGDATDADRARAVSCSALREAIRLLHIKTIAKLITPSELQSLATLTLALGKWIPNALAADRVEDVSQERPKIEIKLLRED
jgi:hypothetical protein